MVFATDGDIFERALIHPDRNNFAPRIGFAYTPMDSDGWSAAATASSITHTVRQGREGLLGFNPPYLVDNLLQTGVTGAAAVASAAPFRLVNGYPSGLLDPELAVADRRRRGPGSEPADALHPAVQHRRPVRADAGRRARCRVCRQQGHEAERLPQPESARRHYQPGRLAVGRRAPVPGVRRHPVDGEPRQLDVQLAAGAPRQALFQRAVRDRQLHAGRGAERARPITSRRAAGAPASIRACSASRRTPTISAPSAGRRSSTSSIASSRAISGNCRSATAAAIGSDWNRAMDLAFGGWQVTGIHVLQSGLALTAKLGGSTVLNLGGERRARPNLVGDPELPESERTLTRWFNTDAFAAFSPAPQAFGNAGVGNHARARSRQFRFHFWPRTSRSTTAATFQFRTELFNAFNHPNFGPPNIARDSSGFGQILTAGNARIIQFGLEVLLLNSGRSHDVGVPEGRCRRGVTPWRRQPAARHARARRGAPSPRRRASQPSEPGRGEPRVRPDAGTRSAARADGRTSLALARRFAPRHLHHARGVLPAEGLRRHRASPAAAHRVPLLLGGRHRFPGRQRSLRSRADVGRVLARPGRHQASGLYFHGRLSRRRGGRRGRPATSGAPARQRAVGQARLDAGWVGRAVDHRQRG